MPADGPSERDVEAGVSRVVSPRPATAATAAPSGPRRQTAGPPADFVIGGNRFGDIPRSCPRIGPFRGSRRPRAFGAAFEGRHRCYRSSSGRRECPHWSRPIRPTPRGHPFRRYSPHGDDLGPELTIAAPRSRRPPVQHLDDAARMRPCSNQRCIQPPPSWTQYDAERPRHRVGYVQSKTSN